MASRWSDDGLFGIVSHDPGEENLLCHVFKMSTEQQVDAVRTPRTMHHSLQIRSAIHDGHRAYKHRRSEPPQAAETELTEATPEQWFRPELTRDQAMELLALADDGAFLIHTDEDVVVYF